MSPSKGISGFDTNTNGIAPKQRRNHLVFWAVSNYQDKRLHLDNCVSDCEKIKDLLLQRYHFEPDAMHFYQDNAVSRRSINDKLKELTALTENDNLLLFFSGHGCWDEDLQTGHWLTHEAEKDDDTDWYPLDTFRSKLKALKAHHLVVVCDACFPGALFRGVMPQEVQVLDGEQSRMALASGRMKPVLDEGGNGVSPFAQALLDLLRENQDEYLRLGALANRMVERVAERTKGKQIPKCSVIPGFENCDGEFSFQLRPQFLSKKAQAADSSQAAAAAPHPLHERLREGSAAYFAHLRAERFRDLDISGIILTGLKNDWLDTEVRLGREQAAGRDDPAQRTPLSDTLAALWQKEHPHALLLGEGGMGKTVSLVRLWEQFLAPPTYQKSKITNQKPSIPIFLQLNDYLLAQGEERKQFLFQSIADHYLGSKHLPPGDDDALRRLLRTPLSRQPFVPSVVLLLDGFNELPPDKDALLIELKHAVQDWQGVQFIVTSRNDLKSFAFSTNFDEVRLQPLRPEQIRRYAADLSARLGVRVELPGEQNQDLWHLLQNPMMLTLYAGVSRYKNQRLGDTRFNFKPIVTSPGELLWNFMESQAIKYYELQPGEAHFAFLRFLFRHFLPWLGYCMEKGDAFVLTEHSLRNAWQQAATRFNADDWWEAFGSEFAGHFDGFRLPLKSNVREEITHFEFYKNFLCNTLRLLVQEGKPGEGNTYRFLHQNFRDFFAAAYLLNEIDLSQHITNLIPQIWTERTFPVYLRRMLGNIEGEHHFDSMQFAYRLPIPGYQPESRLEMLLNKCRGIFHDELVRNTVWNLVMTFAEGRGTLAGMNLERLDLWMVYLNGISLSKHLGEYEYLRAQLKGSLLRGKQFFAQGHTGEINSVCYSPDGKKILSGSSDKSLKEWLVVSGECLQTLTEHKGWVWSVCYSPDGEKILSCSQDSTLKEWSLDNGVCLQTFTGHKSEVTRFCYNKDGKNILSSSIDGNIIEWMVDTGRISKTFIGQSDKIICLCYSKANKKILSGSDDGTVKEWITSSGECLQVFAGHGDRVNSVCYSPDGKKALSSSDDETIGEWSVVNGVCLNIFIGHNGWVTYACYSPDGKKVLSGSSDKTIKEWSVANGECLKTFTGHRGGVNSICYSPDGKKVLSGSSDNTIKEWLVDSGECLQTFAGYSNLVNCVCYSPDGKKALSGTSDGTVKEWSAENGKCLQTFSGHVDSVTSVSYSPDGKKVLSGSRDHTVKEWSVKSGECLQSFFGHKDWVNCVCYSPDGKKVLSGSDDNTVIEWLVQSGECLQSFTGHQGGVTSICYSSDGKKFLSGSTDRTVKEWSVEAGECLQSFAGHEDWVTSVSYSSDGEKIVSRSRDKMVKEWSVESGKCLQRVSENEDRDTRENYSQDEEKILSSSRDKMIRKHSMKSWEHQQIWKNYCTESFPSGIHPSKERLLSYQDNRIVEVTKDGQFLYTWLNIPGLYVSQCDFTSLHPDSHFTDEEKNLFRMYGAIFSDEAERRCNEAVADSYGNLEDDNELETPPQP